MHTHTQTHTPSFEGGFNILLIFSCIYQQASMHQYDNNRASSYKTEIFLYWLLKSDFSTPLHPTHFYSSQTFLGDTPTVQHSLELCLPKGLLFDWSTHVPCQWLNIWISILLIVLVSIRVGCATSCVRVPASVSRGVNGCTLSSGPLFSKNLVVRGHTPPSAPYEAELRHCFSASWSQSHKALSPGPRTIEMCVLQGPTYAP